MSVTIIGQGVGSFQSPGMTHPAKRTFCLCVPRNAIAVDLKIWTKK